MVYLILSPQSPLFVHGRHLLLLMEVFPDILNEPVDFFLLEIVLFVLLLKFVYLVLVGVVLKLVLVLLDKMRIEVVEPAPVVALRSLVFRHLLLTDKSVAAVVKLCFVQVKWLEVAVKELG